MDFQKSRVDMSYVFVIIRLLCPIDRCKFLVSRKQVVERCFIQSLRSNPLVYKRFTEIWSKISYFKIIWFQKEISNPEDQSNRIYATDFEICPTFSLPSKTPFIGQHLKSYFRVLSGSDSLDCLVNPEIVLETEGSVLGYKKGHFLNT